MRRPTLDDCCAGKDSRLPARPGRVFGARLDQLPRGRAGVPSVVARLCGFIEAHGLHCGGLFRLTCGNQKLVEHLRTSFDRTGDADLESVADVASVASLLKLWIRELPEPIIMSEVAAKFLQIQENYTENNTEWREAVCQAILTLPETNIRLLCYLLHFLHNYSQHSPHPKCHHRMSGGVAAVFSTLLILQAIEWKRTIRSIQHLRLSNFFMIKLISEANNVCNEIFGVYSVARHEASQALCIHYRPGGDGANSVFDDCAAEPRAPGVTMHSSQRKRKDCQEPLSMESHERKVIRSNSEERPMEGYANSKEMRRVSSHEDFAVVKGNTRKNVNKHALHEHNTNMPETVSHAVYKAATNDQNMWEEISDDEHERRRSTERFARSVVRRGRRNVSRSRRVFNTKATLESKEGSSSKENDTLKERSCQQQASDISISGNRQQSLDTLSKRQQDQDRSPSPSPTPCSPPLDLRILHQQVDCTEPLTSHGSWSFQPEEEFPNSHVMLSPRNSMILTRRVALDPSVPPSPPQEHNVPVPVNGILAAQARMKHLAKQMTNVKKKLKHYEEEFENKHGYRPSLLAKMDSNEVKKLYAEISKIHKEMAVLKEENEPSLTETTSKHAQSRGSSSHQVKHSRIENLVQDVQKYLKDKRDGSGRPEALREMSLDQMREEKINMQKALVSLENMVGRAESSEHKLVVRPLYNRYRMLKQLIVRVEQFKLKGSVPELETIHEHETMAFTPQPLQSEPNLPQEVVKEQSTVVPHVESSDQKENLVQESDDADNETLWNNLHTLPLNNCSRNSMRASQSSLQLVPGSFSAHEVTNVCKMKVFLCKSNS
ncbi:protein FAM13A isoform X2 [Bacillus rossius redtenbacheri]|uniref:protein FAM13A isoform X2 n=1 Tax=Bacillus rossius redtenbacheri TaxID=93214 RepID=UPI002FDC8BD2